MMSTRLATLVLVAVLAFGIIATAEVPQIISYQGNLTDDSGSPLNATAELTFTLYETEKSTDVIWTETHPVVVITDGLFAVNLGAYTALGSSFTGGERYLAVKIGDEAEITPRVRLASAPFAVKAQRADTAQYAVTAGGASSGLWTSEGDTVSLSDPSSSVGIGLASPQEKLHVDGDIMLSDGKDIHFGEGDSDIGTHLGSVYIASDADIRLVPSGQLRISDYGSSDWAVINPDSKMVGLGTTAPTEQLHLYSDTNGERVFAKLESMHATDWGEVGFRLETPDNRWHLRMDDNSHNNLNAGAIGLRSQSSGAEAMTWEADGSVGINTVDPTEKLDVNGNVRVRDNLTVEGTLTASSISGDFVGSTIDHTNIIDEVGIASSATEDFQSLTSSWEESLTRTISAPAAGYVLALVSVKAHLYHGVSNGTGAYINITDEPGPWSVTGLSFGSYLGYQVNAGAYTTTVSAQKLFYVPSAGTYTYRMIAKKTDDNDVSISIRQMDLLFVPTGYSASTVTGGDIDASEPTSMAAPPADVDMQAELAKLKAELAAMHDRLSEIENAADFGGN